MTKRSIFNIIILALLIVMIVPSVSAYATGACLDDHFTDTATSGWSFHNAHEYSDKIHAASMTMYYHYSTNNPNDRGALINYVDTAVNKIWNNEGANVVIDFVEDSFAYNSGELSRDPAYDNPNIVAAARWDSTAEHTTTWFIVVNTPVWMSIDPSHVRSRVMAHEIGHIYGLGHTDSSHSNYIMKPSGMTETDWVRADERRAMKF